MPEPLQENSILFFRNFFGKKYEFHKTEDDADKLAPPDAAQEAAKCLILFRNTQFYLFATFLEKLRISQNRR